MSKVLKCGLIILMISTIYSGTVTIPNTTVVPIKTVDQLSTSQLTLGEELILNVAQDVTINGKIVIKSGTPVYALVQEVKESQMAGIAGKIVISIQSTVAVDGTNISLTGSFSNQAKSEVGSTVAIGLILCPLALLNKGDDGIIPVGAQKRAMTLGTYDIEVD